ncbi:amidohydrolase family protein [Chloroflexota bacterium]
MILIKNGRIVDGTGNPWFYANIAIEDGKIQQIGRDLEVKADEVIDAQGLVVAPGFVEPHDHSEGYILFNRDAEAFIRQGITTDIIGLCGMSVFPDKNTYVEHIEKTMSFAADSMFYSQKVKEADYDWNSYQEYDKVVMDGGGIACNIVPYLGLGSILWKVGYREAEREKKLTTEQMEETKKLIRKGLEEGAAGVSISRDYRPGNHLTHEDLIELMKVVNSYHVPYVPHVKGVSTVEGVTEAIETSRQSGAKLHIAHLQAIPYLSHGNVRQLPEILGIIDRARVEGLDVDFDVMQTRGSQASVYRADYYLKVFFHFCQVAPEPPKGANTLSKFLENIRDAEFRKEVRKTVLENVGRLIPFFAPYLQEHTDATMIYGTGDDNLNMKTLGEIAKTEGVDPQDLFFDIVFGVSSIIPEGINPYIEFMVISDQQSVEAGYHWLGCPSMDVPPVNASPEQMRQWSVYEIMPRYYRVAMERGIRMEDAIRKMTSFPASCLMLYNQGIIREGMNADIVILDPEEFRRPSVSFLHATAKPKGMYYVIVNGVLVMDNGKLTDARPGKLLFRQT